MKRQYFMPDYYKFQGLLANKYNILDFHAGCHLVHYPDANVCTKCQRKDKCAEIYEQEKNSDIYIAGKASVKEE